MTAAPSDTRHADPATRLVAIAHPRDDIEAQLITNLLADAGIEAMVTGGSLAGFRASQCLRRRTGSRRRRRA